MTFSLADCRRKYISTGLGRRLGSGRDVGVQCTCSISNPSTACTTSPLSNIFWTHVNSVSLILRDSPRPNHLHIVPLRIIFKGLDPLPHHVHLLGSLVVSCIKPLRGLLQLANASLYLVKSHVNSRLFSIQQLFLWRPGDGSSSFLHGAILAARAANIFPRGGHWRQMYLAQ